MPDVESEGDDCDEVNQEESEQNEVDGTKKGADSTGKVNNNVLTDVRLFLNCEIRIVHTAPWPQLYRQKCMSLATAGIYVIVRPLSTVEYTSVSEFISL